MRGKMQYAHWTRTTSGPTIDHINTYVIERRERIEAGCLPTLEYMFEMDDHADLTTMALIGSPFNFNGLLLHVDHVSILPIAQRFVVGNSVRVTMTAKATLAAWDEDPRHPSERHLPVHTYTPVDPPVKPEPKQAIDWFALNKQMAGK